MAGSGGMHRWTSTVEERVCLHRCVIDRRVFAARCPVQLHRFPDGTACDRELGHVLRLTHIPVTLRRDRKRESQSIEDR